MYRSFIIALSIVAAFTCGFYSGGRKKAPAASFHDMVVERPYDYTRLITPKDARIKLLVLDLKTPEQAFAYVRDRVAYDSAQPALPAGDILTEGRASCLGKAVLLCSLYRAMGIPASQVRVVTGEVEGGDGIIDHAWVDMEHKGVCIQQDATDLIGRFTFDQFRGNSYTKAFIRREAYVFNDKQFAVVSRLNQMKGSGHPLIP